MSSLASFIAHSRARSVAVAALIGAAMLASPLTGVRADTITNRPIQLAQAQPGAAPAETKTETVEQRIADLHAAMKITPAQEALWKGVAEDMRENAAAMDKLVAATQAGPPKTAVDDLKTYQKFAQAHVDGLKNLISSFEKLYAEMPEAQKKIADTVFNASERAADTGAPKKN